MLERRGIPTVADRLGSLSFIEGAVHIPFEIARVYYLHGVPGGAERGGHAHRRLHQAMILVSGSLVLRTHDGTEESELRLGEPTELVLIPPLTWRELRDFRPGTVCLVLASLPYEETDYIRTFEDFLSAVRRR